jgi:hypothetical protein
VNGVCRIAACNIGFGNCNLADPDGCEINLTNSNTNCGACGVVCPVTAPNCINSTCMSGPPPVNFTASFVQGQSSPAQCTTYNAFRASITAGPYTQIIMRGTNDPIGVTCTGATANGLCQALRNNTVFPSTLCNGRNWAVGACGGGPELSAMGSICACPSPGYIVRPCIGNSNWGGVNTATCNGTTQTMTIICQ